MLPRLSIPYTLADRDQLRFVHIPKTAGLTLITLLKSQFLPTENCNIHQIEFVLKLPKEQRAAFKLITAHGTYRQFEQIGSTSPVYITMFRDPVERVISSYYHILRHPEHAYYPEVHTLDLKDFLKWDSPARWIIQDQQVRILTGEIDLAIIPDISKAKRTLSEKFIFAGIMERFDDSLELLNYVFNWDVPQDYSSVNVNPKRLKKSEISSSVIDAIREMNQLDIELYNYAVQLFEEQYKLMRLLKQSDQQYEDAASRIRAIFQA